MAIIQPCRVCGKPAYDSDVCPDHAPTADDNNLKHALADDCSDRDCEIHNPEVGLAEGTVSNTNVAFYVAGAYYVLDVLKSYRDDSEHDGESPLLGEDDLSEAANAVLSRIGQLA